MNLTGQPVLSLPLAWSTAEPPIGVQFVGGRGGDPDQGFPVQHVKLPPLRGQFRITWVKRPRVSTLTTTEAHLITQAGDEDINRHWIGSVFGALGALICSNGPPRHWP